MPEPHASHVDDAGAPIRYSKDLVRPAVSTVAAAKRLGIGRDKVIGLVKGRQLAGYGVRKDADAKRTRWYVFEDALPGGGSTEVERDRYRARVVTLESGLALMQEAAEARDEADAKRQESIELLSKALDLSAKAIAAANQADGLMTKAGRLHRDAASIALAPASPAELDTVAVSLSTDGRLLPQ